MNNNTKKTMNKKTLGLAVLVIVVLVLVIVLSLNTNKTTNKTANQKNQANQSQTNTPEASNPVATVTEQINPGAVSASPVVAAALSSMPGSENAPKQEVVKDDKIPAKAIKLSVSESGFTPKEFTVSSGQEVSLAISNTGNSTHVFIFPMASLMGLQTMVSAGETKVTTFTAPNAGTYTFRDDIPNFRQNVGNMIVK
jgi:heme/copper-type cytochrome/quinol oxidase subunit 2